MAFRQDNPLIPRLRFEFGEAQPRRKAKGTSVVSHKYLYNMTRGLYAAGHYVGYL
jgi:hypothetical protein